MEKNCVTITFPHGHVYAIPVQAVAEHRANEYQEPGTKEWQEEVNFVLEDKYEALDWLENNMDWHEIEPHAKLIEDIYNKPLDKLFRHEDTECEVSKITFK